jgi:hypothetical protein
LGAGLITLPCEKENVEKPPRNSAGFCGGGQGLSWAVEPREEEYKGKLESGKIFFIIVAYIFQTTLFATLRWS